MPLAPQQSPPRARRWRSRWRTLAPWRCDRARSSRLSVTARPERVLGPGEEENGPLRVDLVAERRIERFRDRDDTAPRAFGHREEIEIRPVGVAAEGIGNDGEERGMKGASPAVGYLAVDQPVVDARQQERHLRG